MPFDRFRHLMLPGTVTLARVRVVLVVPRNPSRFPVSTFLAFQSFDTSQDCRVVTVDPKLCEHDLVSGTGPMRRRRWYYIGRALCSGAH